MDRGEHSTRLDVSGSWEDRGKGGSKWGQECLEETKLVRNLSKSLDHNHMPAYMV